MCLSNVVHGVRCSPLRDRIFYIVCLIPIWPFLLPYLTSKGLATVSDLMLSLCLFLNVVLIIPFGLFKLVPVFHVMMFQVLNSRRFLVASFLHG